MSTLVAVRVPDELLAKVDAKGKRSQVIIAALEAYLGGPGVNAVVHSLATRFHDSVTVAAKLPSARPAHDPKTCNVYGCGMCQAAKSG